MTDDRRAKRAARRILEELGRFLIEEVAQADAAIPVWQDHLQPLVDLLFQPRLHRVY